MLAKHLFYTFLMLSIIGLTISSEDDECNEVVCGSVVSKCLLMQSCQCKLSDCFCCKDCLNCLGELYTECCSCLDMCPIHNDTLSALGPKSQIGDFEGSPELFDTLTADDDDNEWTTIRFPMRNSLQRHFNMATGSFGFGLPTNDSIKRVDSVNCTVIYLNNCTNNKKCLKFCESMGSNSYRWFHDGCCECVGANCYNYGINESLCNACPEYEEEDKQFDNANMDEDDADYVGENEDDMSWDYGEDEINSN